MRAQFALFVFAAFFAMNAQAGSMLDKGYVEEVDYTQRLPADARCLFGCVKNSDGTVSPIVRRGTRPEPKVVPEERVWVPNREVRYPEFMPRACKTGCVKNADGTYSPKILVNKSDAAKYLAIPDTKVQVTGSRNGGNLVAKQASDEAILAEETRKRELSKRQAEEDKRRIELAKKELEEARLRETKAAEKVRNDAILAEEPRRRELARARVAAADATDPERAKSAREAAMIEAVNNTAGGDMTFNKGLRDRLARDPLTSSFTTRQDFENYMKSENFRNQPSVARLYTDAHQRAEELRQGAVDDRINRMVAAPSYTETTAQTQASLEKLKGDQDAAEKKVQEQRAALEAAERERDGLTGRTRQDNPVVANNGSLGVAVPASETAADADPCKRPGMSHRQAEDCSEKARQKAVQETSDAVARCFYSGFAARNNSDRGNACEPVRSSADAKKLGVAMNGVKETDCGSGMVMCNPLVFGVQSDQRAICVRGTKNASKDCAQKANMASAEAKERHKKLMSDPKNKADLAELERKHKRSCDESAIARTGAYEMNQMQMDRVFTDNIKNRKDKEDHKRTCEVLGHALKIARENLGAVAVPVGVQQGVQPGTADAVQ